MTDYDQSILPDAKGAITLRIDTQGYQGKIKRRASVFTNELRKELLTLNIETVIKVPIYNSKGHIIFKGSAGEKTSKDTKEAHSSNNR